MSCFTYRARDAAGNLDTGVLDAATMEAASQRLRGQGKTIVSLSPAKAGQARNTAKAPTKGASAKAPSGSSTSLVNKQITFGKPKIKKATVIAFSHQLAVMIDTGVPISEALNCVAETTDEPAFKAVLEDVAAHVQSGGELSAAMQAHPKVFPIIMTSLITAAEASGTLGPMLERISDYLTKEQATAKKIKSALTYPAVMLGLVVFITLGLLIFVLPRFQKIYGDRGAALPVPTRMLLTASELLLTQWIPIVIAVVALLIGLKVGLKSAAGIKIMDWAKLNLPLFGSLFSKLYITRATRTLGTMTAAGVPILDMVEIVRAVTVNKYYDMLWDDVAARLRKGEQLSAAIYDSPLIPRSVSQMIVSGEKSGRISQVMGKVADFTESEFDDQVKATTQYIEPAMTVAMGAIIGFVAIALLLPIFSMGKVMSGS